jgi:hypothetical protein
MSFDRGQFGGCSRGKIRLEAVLNHGCVGGSDQIELSRLAGRVV